eukprot:jgi/Mesen1/5323/ME000266S04513
MKVVVLSRSGKEIVKGGLQLRDDANVDDLKAALHKYIPKFHCCRRADKKWYPSRQRFTLPASPPGASPAVAAAARPAVLEPGKKLSEYDTSPPPAQQKELRVVFKDLGPQVGYRTVFFWEYFGPLALYPLFYFFPEVLYPWSPGGRKVTHAAQTYAMLYWSLHYAKRIAETFLVHRFSHATMPVFNLLRNCAYYWAFGVFVSYFVNHPLYTPVDPARVRLGLGLPAGGKAGGYQIPRGFLFEYITCANYTTEILGWVGFCLATQTVAGALFLAAGAYQMSVWAIAKHKRLRK